MVQICQRIPVRVADLRSEVKGNERYIRHLYGAVTISVPNYLRTKSKRYRRHVNHVNATVPVNVRWNRKHGNTAGNSGIVGQQSDRLTRHGQKNEDNLVFCRNNLARIPGHLDEHGSSWR